MKKIFLACCFLLVTLLAVHARNPLANGKPGSTPYDPYRQPVDAVMTPANASGNASTVHFTLPGDNAR